MVSIFKKALVASVALAGLASVSMADPIVTFTIALNDNGQGVYTPGKFAIYVDDSTGDNFGLASLGVDITNGVTNNVGISGLVNQLPTASISDSTFTNPTPDSYGFSSLRSGSSVTQLIGGSQDTISGAYFVMGFGQTGGNVGNPPAGYTGSTVGSPSGQYNAHLLVATGNFTAANPVGFGTNNSGSFANVFLDNDAGNVDTGLINVSGVDLVSTQVIDLTPIPEPASLGVLALGGLALLARRRKTA